MNPKVQIEYRVRPVTRFIVTRYYRESGTGSSEQKGVFEDPDVAYDAAYSMCRVEHESHGWALEDERIQYPKRLVERDVLVDEKPLVVWTPEHRVAAREFNAPPKESVSSISIIQKLQDGGINVTVRSFFDGFWTAKIIDSEQGHHEENTGLKSFAECEAWLDKMARQLYPESDYAMGVGLE